MKHKLVIVENNFCKFFAAKQLLETHFRLNVEVMSAASDYDLTDTILDIKPNAVLCHETLGVLALVEEIKKRNLNRRNSVVYLVIKEDIPDANGIMKTRSSENYAAAA